MSTRSTLLLSVVALVLAFATSVRSEGPIDFIVELENSGGIAVEAPVRSRGIQIGSVRSVGFGEKDVVELGLWIERKFADRVVTESTFVVASSDEESGPWVEHYVLDSTSPAATAGARFRGAGSEAEVWLRRGRMSSEELRESLSKSVEELQEEVERLRSSEDWAGLRDELARLAAELAASGEEVSKMLDRSLPALEREVEAFYQRYQQEIEKRRPTPNAESES